MLAKNISDHATEITIDVLIPNPVAKVNVISRSAILVDRKSFNPIRYEVSIGTTDGDKVNTTIVRESLEWT
jgi:hypothetical protein